MARSTSFFRNLLRRDRVERRLSDELLATLEQLTDENIQAGMSPDEARRRARAALGSLEAIKDHVRDVRAGAFLETLLQDVRYGARLVRRNPLFATTAAVSLAIGIGATTTVATIADALLFRTPVGVVEPQRLVDVGSAGGGFRLGTVSQANYLEIRQRASTLSGVYAYPVFPAPMSLAGPDGGERIYADSVTTNFFAILGVPPAAGRLFDDRDRESAVILSHRFWARRFQGDPSIVGRVIHLNGAPFTVMGVASAGFHGTTVRVPDVWIPMDTQAKRRGAAILLGARLKPGVSIGEASAELDTIGRALERESPTENRGTRFRAAALSPTPDLRGPLAAFLTLLLAIAGVVLAVACTNLVGVLLARATSRRREIAMRLAIGAARARLVRQLLVETLLLFALGGAAGVIVAQAMTSLIVRLLPALPVPVEAAIAIDGRALAFAAGLALIAALVSGLVPALQASKVDLVSAMKDDRSRRIGRMRLRHAFVVAQVALSLVLAVIGGLFARALDRAASFDPGFQPRGAEVAELDLSMAGYTGTTGPRFARALLERLRDTPGIAAATLATVPPGAFEGLGFGITPEGGRAFDSAGNTVEPGYFAALGIPILTGRDFTIEDRKGAPPVAIVSETTARQLWPDRQVVGQYLLTSSAFGTETRLVVGIAGNVAYNSLVDGSRDLFVYLPFDQAYMPRVAIVARGADGRPIGPRLRSLVASMNPALPIVAAASLEDRLAATRTPQRVAAALAGGLGLVGLLLSAIGIYGITAYTVATRSREIGIRLALGARPADVVGMVLRTGMGLVALGSVIGLPIAGAASQLIASLLFGIPPIDLVSFVGTTLVFGAIGLGACYVPVKRAALVDPTATLRAE